MDENAFSSDNLHAKTCDETEAREYCICRSTECSDFMISCDKCDEWFHGTCINLNAEEAEEIDLFYCEGCREKDLTLKVTYKVNKKSKSKKSKHGRKSTCKQKNTDSTVEENKDDFCTTDIEDILFYERKAKLVAVKNLSRKQFKPAQSQQKQRKKKHHDLKQCYGPECTNAARKNSKYCSDACGVRLATNRILEILPQRIRQWKQLPCAADEIARQKLQQLRQKQRHIQNQLDAVDEKILDLSRLIQRGRTSKGHSILPSDSDEETANMDCRICGIEIPMKGAVKHMESCYKRHDRKLLLTSTSQDDIEWGIFCNHRIAKHTYCKKLRVLCPAHYKEFRDEDEMCGYPISRDGYCGMQVKTCMKHPGWKELFRAQLDMDKLQLLIKLGELKKEEADIRTAMANRGDVLGLMLHQTILHINTDISNLGERSRTCLSTQ